MGAIPSHSTPTSTGSWDGPANEARLSNDAGAAVYRRFFAWVDSSGDPDVKASYRFAHHMVSGGSPGAANTTACSTEIGVLNGGRRGTTIPAADRSGVYAHLARHLRDAGREPPPLSGGGRSVDSVEEGAAMPDYERRYTPSIVEVRSSGGRRRIGGYAAVFGVLSRNLGGFVELVTPSFFNKSRADGWPDVIARYNHDDNMLLGTTGAQTLELRIDETGLLYDVDPPQSRDDILELIQRGDVRKSSFAFRVPTGGDEWTLTDQGYPMRQLISGQLVDVAPVIAPAYMDTSVGLRSLALAMGATEEEVRNYADQDELRRFFVRTDNRGKVKAPDRKRLFGPAAVAQLLGRREDPYA